LGGGRTAFRGLDVDFETWCWDDGAGAFLEAVDAVLDGGRAPATTMGVGLDMLGAVEEEIFEVVRTLRQ